MPTKANAKDHAKPAVRVRELTPDLWPQLRRLFEPNGACGGCWCMFWRLEKGERYDDIRGPKARRRFRALVESGRVHGVLAFAGDEPIGWCAFERRVELPRLDRSPSLRIDDADRVWSLPCFYVKAGWRRRGVATKLLAAAERSLRARRAEVLEGYPMPAARSFTGTPSMFESVGFHRADARKTGKQRYRKRLRS